MPAIVDFLVSVCLVILKLPRKGLPYISSRYALIFNSKVTGSTTICKPDFVVPSISSFCAPRGSTSSKHFTVLVVVIAIAGFLGSVRWYKVGDANETQCILACIGFAALLFIVGFEMDCVPQTFLSMKIRVTSWLCEKLLDDMQHVVDKALQGGKGSAALSRSLACKSEIEPPFYTQILQEISPDPNTRAFKEWLYGIEVCRHLVISTTVESMLALLPTRSGSLPHPLPPALVSR